MIILPDMMSWQHYIQLPKIRNLPINEQTRMYNQYLAEQQALYVQVVSQVNAAGSGGKKQTQPSLPSNCIEFTVDTTDGTDFNFDFNTSGEINFTITWGDGEVYEGSGAGGSYNESHTYPETNQQYVARICFDAPDTVTSIQFTGND